MFAYRKLNYNSNLALYIFASKIQDVVCFFAQMQENMNSFNFTCVQRILDCNKVDNNLCHNYNDNCRYSILLNIGHITCYSLTLVFYWHSLGCLWRELRLHFCQETCKVLLHDRSMPSFLKERLFITQILIEEEPPYSIIHK